MQKLVSSTRVNFRTLDEANTRDNNKTNNKNNNKVVILKKLDLNKANLIKIPIFGNKIIVKILSKVNIRDFVIKSGNKLDIYKR